MSDNSVGALAIICIFGAPVAAFVILRILAHAERIEMIRRGMVPPERGRRGRAAYVVPPQAAQAPWAAVPPPPHVAPVAGYDESPERSLRKGITTALVGFALLIGLSFYGYHADGGPFNTPTIHPGVWLLGGLIPMFVGIAQIIVAVLSGARFAPNLPPPPGSRAMPPPSYPGAQPTARAEFDELRRPMQPPDRR